MKTPIRLVLVLAAALAAAGAVTAAGADAPRTLEWDDLMPPDWDPFAKLRELSEGETEGVEDGSEEARRIMEAYVDAGSSAPVVAALDGQRVRLPGYIVPLEFEVETLTEFLLVPYFGACIHVPPPPANQIVYVRVEEPVSPESMWYPVWIEGTLRAKPFLNEVGDAGYTMDATSVERYE